MCALCAHRCGLSEVIVVILIMIRRRRRETLFCVLLAMFLFCVYVWGPEERSSLSSWNKLRHVQAWSEELYAQWRSDNVGQPNVGQLDVGQHNVGQHEVGQHNVGQPANDSNKTATTIVCQHIDNPFALHHINGPFTEGLDPDGDYKKKMAERTGRVEAHCKTLIPDRRFLDSRVPILNFHNHFLHCPITKAASTFWGRFVLKLNTLGTMESPFKILLKKNTPVPKSTLKDVGSREDRARFVNNSVKTLFVREPYNRIFSAYVDKILGPNPYYWREWGGYFRRLKRIPRRGKRGRPQCFHNLTFADVIHVGAAMLYKSELHFVPVTRRCNPCEFKYDVIGKMETFSDDVIHLSRALNLSLTEYFSSEQFRYDYVKDAIEDSINSPFGWKTDILRCISYMEMGLRIWRKLQIRGIIDRRIPFPYTEKSFPKVTAAQFINASLEAHLRSTDRTELKKQKRDAFVEAYRTVHVKVLQQLQYIYRDDFTMFGYDPNLPDIFDKRRNVFVTGAFDWSKPWVG